MRSRKWIGRPKRGEFAPVSVELLIALGHTTLTARAYRLALVILASSYGRLREDVTLTRAQLGDLTSLDRAGVKRGLEELLERGIVVVHEPPKRGGRSRIVFEKAYRRWTPPVELSPAVEPTWRSLEYGSPVAHQQHEPPAQLGLLDDVVHEQHPRCSPATPTLPTSNEPLAGELRKTEDGEGNASDRHPRTPTSVVPLIGPETHQQYVAGMNRTIDQHVHQLERDGDRDYWLLDGAARAKHRQLKRTLHGDPGGSQPDPSDRQSSSVPLAPPVTPQAHGATDSTSGLKAPIEGADRPTPNTLPTTTTNQE